MAAKLILGVFVAAGMVSALLEPVLPVAEAVDIEQEAAQPGGWVQLTPEQGQAMKKLQEHVIAVPERQGQAASQDDAEIICGLEVMRVRPNVDPGIHRQIPKAALNAKIQRITPPVCRGEMAANQVQTFSGAVAVELVRPPKR